MSSGNPHGLSEISHFGSFQRVGGKAGGFINKKFFHPSSIRNQEKLWKAQTADERETRKQRELEKRREEERHVEEMRKQLYLAGQGKASDLFVRSSDADAGEKERGAAVGGKSEQKLALEEEKRRKSQLKRAAEAPAENDQTVAVAGDSGKKPRTLAKSKYQEDVLVQGHSAVWGSWFAMEEKRWGFGCCKSLDRGATCPLPPEEDTARREDTTVAEEGAASTAAASSGEAVREPEAGLKGGTRGKVETVAKKDDSSLMDMRMFEAAERRREKKRLEEERKKEAAAAKDKYLSGLLNNPADAGDAA